MSREPRRRSLRLRITGWMVTSTLLTLIVFCGALYFALEQEDASDADNSSGVREPMTREAGEQMLLAALLAGPVALLINAQPPVDPGVAARARSANTARPRRRPQPSRLARHSASALPYRRGSRPRGT
jgi:hypothetical protein